MVTIRTKNKNYRVNKTVAEIHDMLLDRSSDYLNIRDELIKKREVIGVAEDRLPDVSETPTNQLPLDKRNENLYVLTYLKAYIQKYTKQMGRRLNNDEIRAVIAEARTSWADDVR